MKHICKTLFLLLFFLPVVSSAQIRDQNSYRDLFRQEFDNKNYRKALEYAEEWWTVYPTSCEASYWGGEANFYLKNYWAALINYTDAISHYPSCGYTPVSLAMIYFAKGDANYHVGRFTDAIEDFKLAESNGYSDKNKLYQAFGDAYYYIGQNIEGAEYFGKSINYASTSFHPDLGYLYNMRGTCYYNLKKYAAAIEDFKTADTYGYNDKKTINWFLGNAYFENGQNIEAAEYYGKAISYAAASTELADLYRMRGTCYSNLKKYAAAIEDFKKTDTYGYNDKKSINWSLGNAYFNNGQYKEAAEYYGKAISYASASTELADLYYNRGDCYYNLFEYEKAIPDYTSTIRFNTSYPWAYYKLGQALASTANPNPNYIEARNNYLKAISLADKDFSKSACYSSLIFLERRMLLYGEALKHCTELIQFDPGYRSAYWDRATLYGYKKDYTNALKDFDKTVIMYAEDSGALFYRYQERALTKARLNDMPGALKDYQKAIQIYPKRSNAYIELGKFYKYFLKNKELADVNFQKVMDLELKSDTSVWYSIAAGYMGKLDEAIKNQERLLKKYSGKMSIIAYQYHFTACIYAQAGNKIKALENLEKSMANGFKNYDHLVNDPELEPISATPEYKAILAKYKVPQPKW